MGVLVYLVLGPVIAGIVLAAAWWLIWGRKTGLKAGSVGALTSLAGLFLVLGGAAVRMIGTSLSPLELPDEFWNRDYRFTIPLLIGILGLVVLAFPIHTRKGRGTAGLTPRTPLSFVRKRWLLAPAVVLALIAIVTLAAGAASQPDRDGNYTAYFVEIGGTDMVVMGTTIYGWFYSVPCLILTGVLIAITIGNLVLIARPSLDLDSKRDAHVRTVRTRNIVTVATGTLLIHLGMLFGSLAGTSTLHSQFRMSEGHFTVWTTFAALGPPLSIVASIAAVLGFGLWAAVALSAIPSRRRAQTMVEP